MGVKPGQIVKCPITKAEIEKIAEGVHIGESGIFPVMVFEMTEKKMGYQVKKKELVVTGKYRKFLAARDEKTGRLYTISWVELAMEARKKRGIPA